MFEVRCTYPFDDDFGVNDELVKVAASPVKSSFSGVGSCRDMGCGREIGFEVATFDVAMRLKKSLESSGVENSVVIVREV